jgi:hypothetical protein
MKDDTGSRPSSQPESPRPGAFTISGTPSQPSRSVPHLELRPLVLHRRQPHHDRRHYGHLARDGRQHAIKLLDAFTGSDAVDVHAVDAAWTSEPSTVVHTDNGKSP